MPYDIHDKRRASIHAILSFCASVLTIVLLGKYAGREMEVSTTHGDEDKINSATTTIIFCVFTLVTYIYIFICSLIIIKVKDTVNVYSCCSFSADMNGKREDCPILFSHCMFWVPLLVLFVISFTLNVHDFGILPTTPLQGLIFCYMILLIVVVLKISVPICFDPWRPTEAEKKDKEQRKAECLRQQAQKNAEEKAKAQQEVERIYREQKRGIVESGRCMREQKQARVKATEAERLRRQEESVDLEAQISVIPPPSLLTNYSRSLATPSIELSQASSNSQDDKSRITRDGGDEIKSNLDITQPKFHH